MALLSATVSTLLLSLVLVVGMNDVALFADQPLRVLGVPLRGSLRLIALPLLLSGLLVALRRRSAQMATAVYTWAGVGILSLYWTRSLLLHAPLVTAIVILLLLALVVMTILPPQRQAGVLVAGLAALCLGLPLGVLSYGAIWGETDCDAPHREQPHA
jgi:hypothetical protein